jgi:hypothetical protein
MIAWLKEKRAEYILRRAHRQEFQGAGAFHIRRMAEAGNYDSEKLKNAWDWLRVQDTKFQRLAFITSIVAIGISGTALWISYNSSENARKADRAWVGAATMRLSDKPAVGNELRFILDYQNSGRQPAQDVFYDMDSYTFNKNMTSDIAARATRHISRCKSSPPSADRLTIFPGKGTFEAYRVPKEFVTTTVTGGSDIIITDGCFVYRTLNKIHRTAFCFEYDAQIARGDDGGKPVMNLCNHGHYAD